eukprot:scaffold414995_cov43-Prasinocladus_malaysianus.AAC.1
MCRLGVDRASVVAGPWQATRGCIVLLTNKGDLGVRVERGRGDLRPRDQPVRQHYPGRLHGLAAGVPHAGRAADHVARVQLRRAAQHGLPDALGDVAPLDPVLKGDGHQ